MQPTSFKETNKVFGAGNNPNTDQLAVAVCVNDSVPNIPFIISKWKLSADEVQYIIENRCLYISVMGANLSPILPIAGDPFGECGYKPLDLS